MEIHEHDSHSYGLRTYKVGKDGLEPSGNQFITFVKGVNGVPVYTGVTVEQLLITCGKFIKAVNVGELENEHNTNALNFISNAIRELRARTEERKEAGVLGTDKSAILEKNNEVIDELEKESDE